MSNRVGITVQPLPSMPDQQQPGGDTIAEAQQPVPDVSTVLEIGDVAIDVPDDAPGYIDPETAVDAALTAAGVEDNQDTHTTGIRPLGRHMLGLLRTEDATDQEHYGARIILMCGTRAERASLFVMDAVRIIDEIGKATRGSYYDQQKETTNDIVSQNLKDLDSLVALTQYPQAFPESTSRLAQRIEEGHFVSQFEIMKVAADLFEAAIAEMEAPDIVELLRQPRVSEVLDFELSSRPQVVETLMAQSSNLTEPRDRVTMAASLTDITSHVKYTIGKADAIDPITGEKSQASPEEIESAVNLVSRATNIVKELLPEPVKKMYVEHNEYLGSDAIRKIERLMDNSMDVSDMEALSQISDRWLEDARLLIRNTDQADESLINLAKVLKSGEHAKIINEVLRSSSNIVDLLIVAQLAEDPATSVILNDKKVLKYIESIRRMEHPIDVVNKLSHLSKQADVSQIMTIIGQNFTSLGLFEDALAREDTEAIQYFTKLVNLPCVDVESFEQIVNSVAKQILNNEQNMPNVVSIKENLDWLYTPEMQDVLADKVLGPATVKMFFQGVGDFKQIWQDNVGKLANNSELMNVLYVLAENQPLLMRDFPSVLYSNIGDITKYALGKLTELPPGAIGESLMNVINKLAGTYSQLEFAAILTQPGFAETLKPTEYQAMGTGDPKKELMFWIRDIAGSLESRESLERIIDIAPHASQLLESLLVTTIHTSLLRTILNKLIEQDGQSESAKKLIEFGANEHVVGLFEKLSDGYYEQQDYLLEALFKSPDWRNLLPLIELSGRNQLTYNDAGFFNFVLSYGDKGPEAQSKLTQLLDEIATDVHLTQFFQDTANGSRDNRIFTLLDMAIESGDSEVIRPVAELWHNRDFGDWSKFEIFVRAYSYSNDQQATLANFKNMIADRECQAFLRTFNERGNYYFKVLVESGDWTYYRDFMELAMTNALLANNPKIVRTLFEQIDLIEITPEQVNSTLDALQNNPGIRGYLLHDVPDPNSKAQIFTELLRNEGLIKQLQPAFDELLVNPILKDRPEYFYDVFQAILSGQPALITVQELGANQSLRYLFEALPVGDAGDLFRVLLRSDDWKRHEQFLVNVADSELLMSDIGYYRTFTAIYGDAGSDRGQILQRFREISNNPEAMVLLTQSVALVKKFDFLDTILISEDWQGDVRQLTRVREVFADEHITPEIFTLFGQIRHGDLSSLDPVLAKSINKVGEDGWNQLKTALTNVRESVLRGEVDAHSMLESPLLLKYLMTLTRFSSSEWGKHDDSEIIKLLTNDLDEPKTVSPAYQPSDTVNIRLVDAEAQEAFVISEPARNQYAGFARDIQQAIAMNADPDHVQDLGEKLHKVLKERAIEIGKGLEAMQAKLETLPESARTKLEQKIAEQREELQTLERTNPKTLMSLRNFYSTFSALARHKKAAPLLRQVLFAKVFRKNPELVEQWQERLEGETEPSLSDIEAMANFVQHFTNQETWAKRFRRNGMLKVLDNIASTDALNEDIGRSLSLDSAGSRPFAFVPTRGVLMELSGHIGDACWASKYTSIAKEFPNFTGLVIVQNPNTKDARFAGAAMLIEATAKNGTPLLVIRGLNPIENVITQLKPDDFYQQVVNYVQTIAAQLGRKVAIVIDDHTGGSGTNRPSLFQFLNNHRTSLRQIVLDNDPPTRFNGYNITNFTYLVGEPSEELPNQV